MPQKAAQPFVCLNCDHRWEGTLLVGCTVPEFTTHLEAQKCPKCGNNDMGKISLPDIVDVAQGKV